MNFRGQYKPEHPGFQIAPMIDVVFLLLCFFVMSQVFTQWEAEVDVSLPTAATAEMGQRLPGEIILNVSRAGVVVVNGRTLDNPQLQALLQRVARLFQGQAVVIRADRQTAYEHVMGVLDLCRQSGIWNVSFAALAREDKPGASAAAGPVETGAGRAP